MYRRSKSFKPRAGSQRSRFRRGRSLSRPTANKVWQRANIHAVLDCDIPNTSDTSNNFSIRLASTSSLGATADNQGDALDNAVRSIKVGGIVLGRVVRNLNDNFDFEQSSLVDNWTLYREHLITDRVAANNTISCTPFYNVPQFPIANTTVGASSNNQADSKHAMKVHWSNGWLVNYSVGQIDNLPEGAGVVLDNGRIQPNSTMLNKRLNLLLDDYVNLYYQGSFITSASYAAGLVRRYRIQLFGWLYYRIGF